MFEAGGNSIQNIVSQHFISRCCHFDLILYTSATIGYDVPWTKVHELLISAALKTEGIEAKPEPFVLQKSLDDYSVNYQLNATTRDAIGMPRTHSDLNANILDAFNQAGVEIMSPMFVATRDGANTGTLLE